MRVQVKDFPNPNPAGFERWRDLPFLSGATSQDPATGERRRKICKSSVVEERTRKCEMDYREAGAKN